MPQGFHAINDQGRNTALHQYFWMIGTEKPADALPEYVGPLVNWPLREHFAMRLLIK